MSVRRITPRAPGVAAMLTVSMSSSLVPTLPMWGNVKVMIWPGIGGIGEDLLVAGHGGVEADLADRGSGGAEAESFQNRAVGEHEQGRGLGLGPGGFVLFGGHCALYIVRRLLPPIKEAGWTSMLDWLDGLWSLLLGDGDAGLLRAGGSHSPCVYSGVRGGACALASVYGFLQGAWPFGVVEAIWALIAVASAGASGRRDRCSA